MILTFRNTRGAEIKIGSCHPYWLQEQNGLATADADIATYNIAPDGVNISGKRLRERPINLMGLVTDPSMRDKMLRVCAGKMEGELIAGNRAIRCVVQNIDQPWNPEAIRWGFSLALLAPFPYFYDIVQTDRRIVSWERNWTFPFTLPSAKNFTFGSRADAGEVVVLNEGQVACPCTVRIIATGSVENPSVTVVETGEFMSFNVSMNAGDEVIFTTYPWDMNVYLNGLKNYAIQARRTTFFWLPEGTSRIRYAADSGALSMEVELSFRQYYLGGVE